MRKVSAELHARELGDDLPRCVRKLDVPALRKLFDTSVAFPPDRRRDVGWELHAEAGNPDFLDEILQENKRNRDTFRAFRGMLGFARTHTKYLRWLERKARAKEQNL